MFTKPVKTVLVTNPKAIALINKQAEIEDRTPNHLAVRVIVGALGDPAKDEAQNTGS